MLSFLRPSKLPIPTLYWSWKLSGLGSHMMVTSLVTSSRCVCRFSSTGSGLVVTLPVAGHEATLPLTVFTTTWYVRPGFRFSVKRARSGAPRSMICGVLRRMPMATYRVDKKRGQILHTL